MEHQQTKQQNQENEHQDVLETLVGMFGAVLSPDVIFAVVENCSGDLNMAAEAIINIVSDIDSETVNDEEKPMSEENAQPDSGTSSNTLNAQNVPIVHNVPTTMPQNFQGVPNVPNTMPENFSSTSNMTQASNTAPQNLVNVPNILNNIPQNIPNVPQVSNTRPESFPSTPNVPYTVPYNFSSTSNGPNTTSQNFQSAPNALDAPNTTHFNFVASKSTGAIPKQSPKPANSPHLNPNNTWTEQTRRIVSAHNQGSQILILMRGVPGSGKSYLARRIIDICIGSSPLNYKHIFSTDDFFMLNGTYQHDRSRLSEAHDWNHRRVDLAIREGLSPIIIDNTNIELWEMEPYLRFGVNSGFIIEVMEPDTPWARNAHQLVKRNIHNVPLHSIRRMLDNYIRGFTGSDLIRHFGLSYPADRMPPVQRKLPEVVQTNPSTPAAERNNEDTSKSESRKSPEGQHHIHKSSGLIAALQPTWWKTNESNCSANPSVEESNDRNPEKDDIDAKQQHYKEIEKQLEEILKVEDEWDNGEKWDENRDSHDSVQAGSSVEGETSPKPPGNDSQECTPRKDLLESVKECEDWSKISIFMPPWKENEAKDESTVVAIPTIAMKSASTCIESGDTDVQNPKKVYKVIIATPKDINFFHIPLDKERIPQKRMLDKSTMTNDFEITGALQCKYAEQHFISLRKMFRNVSKANLRDIFDKCFGDVNWAVDIILDGVATNQLPTVEECDPDSDLEEEPLELCDCLAVYNIIPSNPSVAPTVPNATTDKKTPDNEADLNATTLSMQKKRKPSPSDVSVELKRQIEQNFVIADNRYSDRCLKIRNWRHGDLYNGGFNWDSNVTTPMSDVAQALPSNEDAVTTGAEFGPVLAKKEQPNDQTLLNETKPSSSTNLRASVSRDSDEESHASSLDERESTVNISLGWDFISALDKTFGREGVIYPDHLQPNINIPVTLLNEVNAFWIESVMTQMDERDKLNTKLLKQDEDLARQIQVKEQELARQGKEPEVPDFKEIMDMDFALSLYQKEVAEWRNKEPSDLAARMTRDKLYNLFPEMSKDVLSELLMAHDNNFQATVETFLISTGKAAVLNDKNGLNKFVMEKELERQQKILEEEQKALSEVEWPLLPKGENVDMSAVDTYRAEAEKHLQRRQRNYDKVSEYVRRGMPQVATHFSELAHFHTQQYEHNCSLAAVCLMQIHAAKCPNNGTIDLHYMRVGEARETLDLFIDTHINKLKDSLARNQGPRVHKLFLITGRGAHSQGGRAKVKPAMKKRLKERGLGVSECNPGLLTTQVTADDKLSHEVASA